VNSAGQIALALIVVVGYPVWDWFHMRHARAQRTPAVRLMLYRTIVVVLWATAVCAVWLVGNDFQHLAVTGFPSLQITTGIAWGLCGGVLVATLGSLAAVYVSKPVAVKFGSALAPISFLLPRSVSERWWFAAVSVTAGVCEEIIYRGFLPHVGTAVLGMHWVPVVVISLLAFGTAHTYQGVRGAIGATLLGGVFMAIYLGLGVLWPAMVVHALIDLRIALLPERAMPVQRLQ